MSSMSVHTAWTISFGVRPSASRLEGFGTAHSGDRLAFARPRKSGKTPPPSPSARSMDLVEEDDRAEEGDSSDEDLEPTTWQKAVECGTRPLPRPAPTQIHWPEAKDSKGVIEFLKVHGDLVPPKPSANAPLVSSRPTMSPSVSHSAKAFWANLLKATRVRGADVKPPTPTATITTSSAAKSRLPPPKSVFAVKASNTLNPAVKDHHPHISGTSNHTFTMLNGDRNHLSTIAPSRKRPPSNAVATSSQKKAQNLVLQPPPGLQPSLAPTKNLNSAKIPATTRTTAKHRTLRQPLTNLSLLAPTGSFQPATPLRPVPEPRKPPYEPTTPVRQTFSNPTSTARAKNNPSPRDPIWATLAPNWAKEAAQPAGMFSYAIAVTCK